MGYAAGPNSANFNSCAIWNDQIGNVTTVGSNGGPSYYGTYDQSGNVHQWNDLDETVSSSSIRGIRGGYWFQPLPFSISSASRGDNYNPDGSNLNNLAVGFRLASSLNPLNLSNFVDVADPSNANDSTGYGAVSYNYKISQYLVTNCEYAEFLNAVAKTDSYGLYNSLMDSDARAGINRSGSSGSYTYTVKTNMGNKPVIYVSWFDAARYCNWLHNGKPNGSQGNGTTETGAYILNGATSGNAVAKNSGALYWIPTENEWYKAAYYSPIKNNGAPGYWSYATQSDTAPNCVSANSVGDGPVSFDYCCNNDIGVSWIARESNRDWRDIASSSDGKKLAAVVNNGRIYVSADAGNTWTATGDNRYWNCIASNNDGSKLIAGAANDQVYISTNGGLTWNQSTSINNLSWYSITSSDDGNKIAALAQDHSYTILNSYIYTSNNGGSTWQLRNTNNSGVGGTKWQDIAISNDGIKLVAVAYGGQIYTSADSGISWIARENNRNWMSVASNSDGTKLVAVAYGGQIYTSVDSGISWTARENNRNWISAASSNDGSKLVALVSNGQIYISSDGGDSWIARETNRYWRNIASNSDGTKLAALVSSGQIYTSNCNENIAITPTPTSTVTSTATPTVTPTVTPTKTTTPTTTPIGIYRTYSNNNTLSITDNAIVTQTIIINDNYNIYDIDVGVDISHSFDGDLIITLISPNNQRFILANRNGGSGDNFTNTIFDSEASASIVAGVAPFTGRYAPVNSLTSLYGTSTLGSWSLEINDTSSGDVGTLNNFYINFQILPNPTPIPTSTLTPTPTKTTTPSSSVTNTPYQTPSPTSTITPTKSITPSITPTNSLTPSITPTKTVTPSITPTNGIRYHEVYFPDLDNKFIVNAKCCPNTPTISITPTKTPTSTKVV